MLMSGMTLSPQQAGHKKSFLHKSIRAGRLIKESAFYCPSVENGLLMGYVAHLRASGRSYTDNKDINT